MKNRIQMWRGKHLIHTTREGIEIYVSAGKKSEYDFKVQYRKPGKGSRVRTPKHIHMVIDLYLKKVGNEKLASELTNYIIENLVRKVRPSTVIPPSLQVYSPNQVQRFKELDIFGEYSVEFVLVATELILIQERTNYPLAIAASTLYEIFRDKDLYAVINAATWRGRK